MPRKQSAGLIPYRLRDGVLEVFLVHPGGPFWARKDEGAWSIAKGECGDSDAPLEVARREFLEETGGTPAGPYHALGSVRQAGGKLVHAWAFQGDIEPSAIVSNTFELEWPPRSGRRQSFPEVDRAAWFTVAEARRRILGGQAPFLDRLEDVVAKGVASAGP